MPHTLTNPLLHTERARDLRDRVRTAMECPPVQWTCPARIDDRFMTEPLPVRKARAIALKLSHMPPDLWAGQLFAGSMTLEEPRLQAEHFFPDYTTEAEREAAAERNIDIRSVFGHVVPDYPRLLGKGLRGILADVDAQRSQAQTPEEHAFLDSAAIAMEGVIAYAGRLATRCETEALVQTDPRRAAELDEMAANLRQVPAGSARTFWQALQSIWLLHMIFHATMNGNAMGRVDQYVWPYLDADLRAGRIDLEKAAELTDCST